MIRRPRKRTFLILVAVSLLVPALLLSLLGLKLLRDFTKITGNFQAEYGDYMAQIAARSVENALWEKEQLIMVAARLAPPENPAEVPAFLDDFLAANPHYLMPFFVAPTGLEHYSQVQPKRTESVRPLPAWILNPIMQSLKAAVSMPSGLKQLSSPDSLPPMQVTYFTLTSETGELLGAAGFVWDLERIKHDRGFFERALKLQLSRNKDIFRGDIFQSPVAIHLLDERGKTFFTTADLPDTTYIAKRPFSRVLPFYQVGVLHLDNRFDSWIQSVVRTNLASIAAMLLAIVSAVIFSLRFIFHEMELAELKSTLVSNVSHELKTPLALIRLFSETLEMGRTKDEKEEKDFLRVIHKESERLTHLIDNVLDMGRIEQGRKSYHMHPADLTRVVRETLDAYRLQLEEKGFALETHLEDGIPEIPLDSEAMTQALLNLMDNAVKYSPEEKQIRVDLARRNGEAVISVEDKGVGISPREQGRIFDMFYRVEKGLVHSVKGSGLGLSLVKHIVDAHGGHISLDSKLGKGSRFSIHLPLSPENGEIARKEESSR